MIEQIANRVDKIEKIAIPTHLRCIEQEYEVKILFAVESSSNYNHIYNKHNERYLQKEGCSMKRFLYYLRGILACEWIESHCSPPPVPFKELVDETIDNEQI